MGFVTEYIPVEDEHRVGWEKIRIPAWMERPSNWTVDRESGVFLLRIWRGREEERDQESFVLGWGNYRIGIGTIWKVRDTDQGRIYTFTLCVPLALPTDLETKRIEILIALKDALTSDFFYIGKAHHLEFDF